MRSLRGPKEAVDPWAAPPITIESERLPAAGGLPARAVEALTVFLHGAECPFTCVFCDLWRHTLDTPTPPGALPRQLELALAEAARAGPLPELIKLYNASNFFDSRAVPEEDDEPLARLLEPFLRTPDSRVVVECHPRLVGERCRSFGERVEGRLQVALGVETVHPEAQPRLGKGASLDDLRAAVRRLRSWGLGWRAFVLVAAPFVPAEEDLEWVAASARFALDEGAEHIALIPVRGGDGALEELARRGEFHPPSLGQLEQALDRCLELASGQGVIRHGAFRQGAESAVTADLWDLERFSSCPSCLSRRRERLERINLSGRTEASIHCEDCSHG
ncbi:MAG: radical SAM protein [Acidobacteriota bacterium]|nr:radical SAM protein [Acidobacteriota bacterium]